MKYSFRQYQPLSLRLWHWLNALVILGLLGTVALRKTFLSWRANTSLIESKVQAAGGTLPPGVAKNIATTLRDQMWDWHFTLGFVLGGLLLVRILVGIFARKQCPATCALNAAKGLSQVPASEKKHALHYTLVKTGYAFFYLVTLFMVLSGLTMYFKETLHVPEGLEEGLKEIHETAMWFFVVFIVGHLGGVVMAELRGDRGLVSDMINGGDK